MGRRRKQRRQAHGSAWHWKQTDCWYYTLPDTRQRVPLFDARGERIRGTDKKEAAEMALAKERLTWAAGETAVGNGQWLVARVCSDYIQYCEAGLAKGQISKSHQRNTVQWLNDLCAFCGALPVAQLKTGHVTKWLDGHVTWKSSQTRRSVIAVVQAAFNRADELYGIANPIKSLKRPKAQPRLASFTPEEEQTLYEATEVCFGNFLFAAVHTGLRPFCELAKLTADEVEETDKGMMWRVYSSKTKKTRKIPVRPEVAKLTRALIKEAPRGSGLPIFRNTQGNPWKRMTGVVRFIALKEKLGWDQDPVKARYSCYTCRHTFAHRMLAGYWNGGAGCTIETLAELMGDTPKVAFDHYGKEWGQHYQQPLWNAIGEGAGGAASRRKGKAAPAKRPASKAKRTTRGKSATPSSKSRAKART